MLSFLFFLLSRVTSFPLSSLFSHLSRSRDLPRLTRDGQSRDGQTSPITSSDPISDLQIPAFISISGILPRHSPHFHFTSTCLTSLRGTRTSDHPCHTMCFITPHTTLLPSTTVSVPCRCFGVYLQDPSFELHSCRPLYWRVIVVV
ncbi:hypothetical protein F5148DRAFT_553945 [Russula earlei]|uniref:Uncharacterized protein n=1 Tax=Russula earlei TaxID=71964 RepID=A0ACC0UHP6_9AGAM|nr:hypothetical protein F5148DRAFT_553945 [Russula earlei]